MRISHSVILALSMFGLCEEPSAPVMLASGDEVLARSQGGLADDIPAQILDWKQPLQLPDDILFVHHVFSSPLVVSVSLNSDARVNSVISISGFSLYLKMFIQKISETQFPQNMAGTTISIRLADPLQTVRSAPAKDSSCTSTMDLHALYLLGEASLARESFTLAAVCFRMILSSTPSSLAARYGIAVTCPIGNSECSGPYLESVVESNPDFIEAQWQLAYFPKYLGDDTAYVHNLDKLLKLDASLAERKMLLDAKMQILDDLNRTDEELQTSLEWIDIAKELMDAYQPTVPTLWLEAEKVGLLEEGKRKNLDALHAYQLARSAADGSLPPGGSGRYILDLDLARTFRKTGDNSSAEAICNRWRTRWRGLAKPQLSKPWQLSEDGVGELEGRWEFSCGDDEKGLEILQNAARRYPNSPNPFYALAEYYDSEGDSDKARLAAATATALFEAWERRARK